MAAPPLLFDRALLRQRRNRVAADAAANEFLLERTALDLCERLTIVRRKFATALVVGAHHGLLGRRLAAIPGIETVLSLESAGELFAACDDPKVQGDEEALPFEPGSMDLVVSAHALHLVNDLPGVLSQIRRILRPDGLLLAAFPGAMTLTELRQSWLAAESEIEGGASPRVAPFADVRDGGALLQRAGFALPVADSETVTVTFSSPLAAMAGIKAMGASNMLAERSRRPVTRGLLMRAAAIYAERFALPDGRVPATFEILTLTGWCPDESQQKPLAPGSAVMRLADALGTAERKI